MCSDPHVRHQVLMALEAMGGKCSAYTHGGVARLVQPAGATVKDTKAALNSLAYSANREPRVVITRPDGLVKVAIIRP